MTANPILLQKKYSRVIECFAKQQGLSHWRYHLFSGKSGSYSVPEDF